MLGIEGQTGGLLAGRQWKALEHLQCPGVELDDLACVFHVDEDVSLVVGDGQLGNAVERKGAYGLHLGGVDRRGVVCSVIECKDSAADRLEVDDVGASVSLDLAEGL